jgi:L,D-transpeptidase YcbB
MFAGMINYAILNPYWNVPVDLATNKVAPKILAGRSLKTMRMEALSDWGESATKVKQSSIDWKAVAAGQQEVRLRQLPGTTNAMGRVKFLFPNQEGIYLHDTPERDLFKKTDRHFSNGCIRLEDAARLGNWLLGKSIKAGSKAAEQTVPLPAPVPIYITYFTATTGKSGELAFLKDVYRRDP